MPTADDLLARTVRRAADREFDRVAGRLDGAAALAERHGDPSAAPAWWAANGELRSRWWSQTQEAALRFLDALVASRSAQAPHGLRDGRGAIASGTAAANLVAGWERFAADQGLDPDWTDLPGADVVRRVLDTRRRALAEASPATDAGEAVNFGLEAPSADQITAGLGRQLAELCGWWAGPGA
jgi:hypothetical protein